MGQRLTKVGVIGAGAMGRSIAQVCAAAECNVKLFDSSRDALGRALQSIRADLSQAVARGKLTQEQQEATLARIEPIEDSKDLGDRQLVVEAIIEDLSAKQGLLRELEPLVEDGCILATNTSSLSVTAIASACREHQRVVGWHFFNPVPRMKLVEVIQAPRTLPDVAQATMKLSQRIGHRAILASDSPGFVVNHAGRAFVTEGLKLLSERTAGHLVLDAITKAFAGFRMGPLELLDLTGLDVSVPVMESIHAQYYGDDSYRQAALAHTRMQAGLLGRKAGRGFYYYTAQAQVEPVADTSITSWRTRKSGGLRKGPWHCRRLGLN